jgi:predicted transposase/invertase (TIGR01784 family)
MGVHDSGYRHLFSFRAMVEDLLRGFVREQWVDDLDFETLERKNESFISDDLREREDDIIWRAKWKGSDEWMYVYFLIEFQSESDKYMALRMVNYVTLLYQDLIKTGEVRGRALPPVLPMVIYRGEQTWTSARDIKDLIRTPPPGLVKYLPSMKYLLLEEIRMNDTDLERMSNLVAELFRIENSTALNACIPPFLSFLKWTYKAGPEQKELKRAVKAWFARAQKPAKLIDADIVDEMAPEEMEPMLSEKIERWSKELRSEGMAEGELRGRVDVAKKMLQKGMSVKDISEVTELSEKEIFNLKRMSII